MDSFNWGEKVVSTKSVGTSKYSGEVLIFCCLNPARTRYAIVLTEDGDIAEIEANNLIRATSTDEDATPHYFEFTPGVDTELRRVDFP